MVPPTRLPDIQLFTLFADNWCEDGLGASCAEKRRSAQIRVHGGVHSPVGQEVSWTHEVVSSTNVSTIRLQRGEQRIGVVSQERI